MGRGAGTSTNRNMSAISPPWARPWVRRRSPRPGRPRAACRSSRRSPRWSGNAARERTRRSLRQRGEIRVWRGATSVRFQQRLQRVGVIPVGHGCPGGHASSLLWRWIPGLIYEATRNSRLTLDLLRERHDIGTPSRHIVEEVSTGASCSPAWTSMAKYTRAYVSVLCEAAVFLTPVTKLCFQFCTRDDVTLLLPRVDGCSMDTDKGKEAGTGRSYGSTDERSYGCSDRS